MNQSQRDRKALTPARCGQEFLVLHHALLLPSILVPPVVSLFDAPHYSVKYTIVAAPLATALSLGLKLELRAYMHARAERDYLMLVFDTQSGEDTRARANQLLREAPMLPACICEGNNSPAGDEGEPGQG